MAALSALSAPSARVLRDGTAREVAAAVVVPGDVMLLGEGDIVTADAELIEASALLIDESMLTGESVPVHKDAGSLLGAGTVVMRGRGVATVAATGAAGALGRIAALLDDTREPTPLQHRLASLGRILAAATLGLCLVVFALGLVRGLPAGTMAVTAISLAVAAVPESSPAVVTLALALGARRMAARHALVRRLPAVETLGSVTVLATDKTGTLTEGRMVVQHVWTPSVAADIFGVGYEPQGDVQVDGKQPTPAELGPVATVVCLAAGVVARAWDLPWQSVLFLSLLGAQLGVVMGLRTRLLTRQNLFFPLAVLASALLAVAALYVPPLRSVLETDPLGWSGAALATAALMSGYLAARLTRNAFPEMKAAKAKP
ncbi:HAD-IC family P-type ATPase [Streptomyces sp. NPDC058092]|uniref:HAD-IC family P-type ATPase n=1 Tax=Streptomyces sp. NPDC058092 TaxID=3346336 RepID=UPI0036EB54C3